MHATDECWPPFRIAGLQLRTFPRRARETWQRTCNRKRGSLVAARAQVLLHGRLGLDGCTPGGGARRAERRHAVHRVGDVCARQVDRAAAVQRCCRARVGAGDRLAYDADGALGRARGWNESGQGGHCQGAGKVGIVKAGRRSMALPNTAVCVYAFARRVRRANPRSKLPGSHRRNGRERLCSGTWCPAASRSV